MILPGNQILLFKLYSIDGCIERPFRRILNWAERAAMPFFVVFSWKGHSPENWYILNEEVRKLWTRNLIKLKKINGRDWPNRYHICILSCTPSCIFSKPFIYYYIAFIAFKCKKEIYYDCQLYFILTKQKKNGEKKCSTIPCFDLTALAHLPGLNFFFFLLF